MSVGRGWDAASASRTIGRGRARFSAQAIEGPNSEVLLRRQSIALSSLSAEPFLTPVTPTAPPPAVVKDQFANYGSEAGAFSTPQTPGMASGSVMPQRRLRYGSEAGVFSPPQTPGVASSSVTPQRRLRFGSEASSPFDSMPHSTVLSYNFPGDDHPDCVCNRDKKLVICLECKETYSGRVRQKCSVHSNVRMLMDIDECKCGSSRLYERDV